MNLPWFACVVQRTEDDVLRGLKQREKRLAGWSSLFRRYEGKTKKMLNLFVGVCIALLGRRGLGGILPYSYWVLVDVWGCENGIML